VRPSVVLLMETEIWFRFLRECAARGIPVALVNGRISERSFRRYQMIRGFVRRVLDTLALGVMQTDDDAARLRALGLAPERVRVSGNIKFDLETDESSRAVTEELRARFRLDDSRPLVVAASTHAHEERILLEAFKLLLSSAQSATDQLARPRLLIAPRHPERFAEVASLLDASGLSWARRSTHASAGDSLCDVVLLDSVGELRAVYPLAELVFVGGSITHTGGHNVLEPAAEAKCIVTGAHTFNFTEIVRRFVERDALVQLPDLPEAQMAITVARTFDDLLSDEERRRQIGARALEVLRENRGATARTIEMLAPIIEQRAEIREQRSEISG
jgi:3-deoxy-D-manno-octulosonic-acid transferase